MTNFEIKETENSVETCFIGPEPREGPTITAVVDHASNRRRDRLSRFVLWNPVAPERGGWFAHSDCTAGRAFGLSRAAEASCAGAGDYPARKYSAVHFVSHLRAHRRLLEKVVFRHRRARKGGRIACDNPVARG